MDPVTPGLWRARRRGQNHRMSPIRVAAGRLLPWLFALYAAATLLHFAHNGHYLARYPNLPASWSGASVYAAWGAEAAAGTLLLINVVMLGGGATTRSPRPS
jgi:hypothetical protein